MFRSENIILYYPQVRIVSSDGGNGKEPHFPYYKSVFHQIDFEAVILR